MTHVAVAEAPASWSPTEAGYAAILTHVQSGAPARLAAACDLAKRFGALLTGVGVEAVPPVAAGPATGMIQADWCSATSEAVRGDLARARVMFEAATAGAPYASRWIERLDIPLDVMARAARAADLVVASAPAEGASTWRDAAPADLALACGRPVLALPPGAAAAPAQRIVLAWKDTREARRAMSDAIPLMRRAAAVFVLEVASDDLDAARVRTAEVAAALGRHGVPAEPTAAGGQGADGTEILRQADALGADLIVAGAYGHSRVGEMVFGGVTRTLLRQGGRPVLLSH